MTRNPPAAARLAALTLLALVLCGCVSHVGAPRSRPAGVGPLAFTVERDVVYTAAGGPAPQRADVYRPVGSGPFPAVVVVHGGGWDRRDRSDMDGISEKLAGRGYVVANIDYRLAPAHRYPAALEDTQAAIRWMRANAARLHVNAERVGGWGYSAGGHLVALAGMLDEPADTRLQAVVAGGTPSDLPHYPVSPIITRFIGAPFAQARETWLAASPVTHVDAGDPPVFQYHGTWDKLVHVEDADTFKAALDRAGVANELYRVRGSGHIGTFLLGFGAEAAAIDFLDRQLR